MHIRDIRPADLAWLAIVIGAIAYELMADDLLSDSMDRRRASHPILTRLAIVALAGHFTGYMPKELDLFSAQNVVHRFLMAHYPWARDRFADRQRYLAGE